MQYSVYDGNSQPIVDHLSTLQLNAVQNNPDLRKKLRVDRVRKMTLGAGSSLASVEDPSQPEWMKVKSLREIETIRETKKRDILNQVMGAESMVTCPTINVMPGHLAFSQPIPVVNETNQMQVFSVRIIDPDEEILGGHGCSELKLVQDAAELNHWVAHGKVPRPPSFDAITRQGDMRLQPKERIDLLFKFLTKREVSFSPNASASRQVIRPRKIKVFVMQNNV